MSILETRHVKPEVDAALERFAGGDVNFWCVNVVPDTDQITETFKQYFNELIKDLEVTTEIYGYEGWGVKTPFQNPVSAANEVMRLIPESRHIFMVRDLVSVVKSMLGRKWNVNKETIDHWQSGILEISNIRETDHTLILCYDVFVDNPEAGITKLESFLDITEIDRDVMKVKVNTFTKQSSTEYVEPGKVNKRQHKELTRLAKQGIAAYYEIRERCGNSQNTTS
jgi:hypothetical protein